MSSSDSAGIACVFGARQAHCVGQGRRWGPPSGAARAALAGGARGAADLDASARRNVPRKTLSRCGTGEVGDAPAADGQATTSRHSPVLSQQQQGALRTTLLISSSAFVSVPGLQRCGLSRRPR